MPKTWGKKLGIFLFFGLIIGIFGLSRTAAFNGRDLVILNVAIPVIQAGLRARRNETPVGPALLQAAVGGLIMQKGFEVAAETKNATHWKAWQAKLLVNTGASIAESAGSRFQFRMDIGPVWMIADAGGCRFRLGMHGVIAPLLNLRDGAKIDLERSFRFGTTAMTRHRRADGTIGANGALAYSNANNFITDPHGNHVGHELVHTFQYRRDAFESPKVTSLLSIPPEKFDRYWVDDTGWGLNWAEQWIQADLTKQNKDFDLLMEKEAYYLSDKIH